MAKFVTISGGKIRRAKGRFGGESAGKCDHDRKVNRGDRCGWRRRSIAADTRLALLELDDCQADFGSRCSHDEVDADPAAAVEAAAGSSCDRVARRDEVVERVLSSATTVSHNDREVRRFRNGMRIHSAQY